jgi:uncharacterized membrane protein YebE (DUF533 family)
MDAEHLIETLIRGALGSRRKRSRGALRFLTGGRHSLLNAGTLLTAAGVAWGLYETMLQQGSTPVGASGRSGPASPPSVPTRGLRLQAEDQQRGDVPAEAGSHTEAGSHADAGNQAEAGSRGATESLPPEVLRVIRLTIAAARADGTLTTREEDAILAHARTVGAESLVREELQRPTPLAALVAGAPAEQHRDLYTLAFAVARADETVSGGERIFLAQLAHQLGLDTPAVATLEASATARISEGA